MVASPQGRSLGLAAENSPRRSHDPSALGGPFDRASDLLKHQLIALEHTVDDRNGRQGAALVAVAPRACQYQVGQTIEAVEGDATSLVGTHVGNRRAARQDRWRGRGDAAEKQCRSADAEQAPRRMLHSDCRPFRHRRRDYR